MSRGASRRVASEKNPNAGGKRELRGAHSYRRGFSHQVRSYFGHHRASLLASLRRLKENSGQTLMSSSVVAVALALPALLFVALDNLESLGERWDTEPKMSLYLHPRAQTAAIDSFMTVLRSDPRVASLHFISAEEALDEFQRLSGFGAALSGLASNPLPSVIELTFVDDAMSGAAQAKLVEELQREVLVEEASVDLAWVERFLAITALASNVVLLLALLLGVGALIAVGNTVRLIIENRKDEIIIVKLVGGTNGFVRRPLLYAGVVYGFVGGVLAWLIVSIGLVILGQATADISIAYASDFQLQGLGVKQTLGLFAVGALLGWFGAWLAVGRHLSEIEPS